jgi:hypothetical protein
VERNRALIVAPREARIKWRLTRLSPLLLIRLSAAMAARSSATSPTTPGPGTDTTETESAANWHSAQ